MEIECGKPGFAGIFFRMRRDWKYRLGNRRLSLRRSGRKLKGLVMRLSLETRPSALQPRRRIGRRRNPGLDIPVLTHQWRQAHQLGTPAFCPVRQRNFRQPFRQTDHGMHAANTPLPAPLPGSTMSTESTQSTGSTRSTAKILLFPLNWAVFCEYCAYSHNSIE